MSFYDARQQTTTTTEDDNKMLYQVWYDHPKGSTVVEVRAVNKDEAEKIVENDNPVIVVTAVEPVFDQDDG